MLTNILLIITLPLLIISAIKCLNYYLSTAALLYFMIDNNIKEPSENELKRYTKIVLNNTIRDFFKR